MSVGQQLSEPRGRGDVVGIAAPAGTNEATHATIERLVRLNESLAERCAQLQQALDSRIVIEQAKGMLSERLGVSPDEAFVVLRRAARSSRVRIHDLAAEVVSSPRTPQALETYV